MTVAMDLQKEAIDTLVETLRKEALERRSKPLAQWIEDEPIVMWKRANSFASQRGLRSPSLEEVQSSERMARGHVDYERKWALGIARAMEAV